MIRIFEFLVHGCWHHWCARDMHNLVRTGNPTPYGTRYVYQCDKCHRIKKQDVV